MRMDRDGLQDTVTQRTTELATAKKNPASATTKPEAQLQLETSEELFNDHLMECEQLGLHRRWWTCSLQRQLVYRQSRPRPPSTWAGARMR